MYNTGTIIYISLLIFQYTIKLTMINNYDFHITSRLN